MRLIKIHNMLINLDQIVRVNLQNQDGYLEIVLSNGESKKYQHDSPVGQWMRNILIAHGIVAEYQDREFDSTPEEEEALELIQVPVSRRGRRSKKKIKVDGNDPPKKPAWRFIDTRGKQ